MNTYRLPGLTALFLVCCVSAGGAQVKDAPETRENVPPQIVVPVRNIEFVKMDTPYTSDLFRADPMLLEQKFAARFKLLSNAPRVPRRLPPGGMSVLGSLDGIPMLPWNPREYRSYSTEETRPRASTSPLLISPYRYSLPGTFRARVSTSQYFDTLLKLMPEAKRPAAAVMDLLRKQADAGLIFMSKGTTRRTAPVGGGTRTRETFTNHPIWDIVVMAPNEDLAKKLARAMLALWDEGLSRHAQGNALKARAKMVKDLQTVKQDLEKNVRLEEAKSKSLESMTLIDKSALADFRQRKNLLEVDLAGARARIEAADRLLHTGKTKPSTRYDQIVNLKIAAEIELAGLVAQQKTVAHLIELGEQRAVLAAELKKQTDLVVHHRLQVRLLEAYVAGYDDLLKTYLRPLELIDDRVTICPVKWASK